MQNIVKSSLTRVATIILISNFIFGNNVWFLSYYCYVTVFIRPIEHLNRACLIFTETFFQNSSLCFFMFFFFTFESFLVDCFSQIRFFLIHTKLLSGSIHVFPLVRVSFIVFLQSNSISKFFRRCNLIIYLDYVRSSKLRSQNECNL